MTDREKVSAVSRDVMKYRRGEFPYDDSEGYDNAIHLIDTIEALLTEK